MNLKPVISKVKSFFTAIGTSVKNIFKRKDKYSSNSSSISRSSSSKSGSGSSNYLFLRKFKIQTRLIGSFVFLLVATLLITGITSYSNSTKTIDNKVKTYSLQVMNQTSVVLENEIERMENYFMDIGLSGTLQTALSQYNVTTDDYEKLMQTRSISEYLTTKFVTTKDVDYCGILHTGNTSQKEEYNSSSLVLDTSKIPEEIFKQIQWMDFDVEKSGKKGVSLGMIKDINSITSGENVARMIIVPKDNFLANAFSGLDIGTDSKTDKGFPIFVVDSKGSIVSSRDTEAYPLRQSNEAAKLVSASIAKDIQDNKANSKNASARQAGNIELNVSGQSSLVTYSALANKDWYVVSVIPYNYLNSDANKLRTNIIIIGFICVIVAMLMCLAIAKSVSSPLRKLVQTMKKAREGDLTSHIVDGEGDEIGDVCRNYNDMLSNINALVSQVRKTSQNVLNAAAKIAAASESTYSSSEQVAVTVEQIAKGATDQANEINESVSHMDKLSEGITYVEDDVSQVISIANKISSLNANADTTIKALNVKSGQVSDTTNRVSDNITNLSSSMKEIQKILKIMIGISEQTNLLSLNAAIEAARAGEAGKGFAVVANEVKKLAEQSKEFTSNINNIISSIGQKTNDTVQEVMNSNEVVNEQILAVRDTEELFKTVFAAMHEVLTNIERTEKSVGNIMSSKAKVLESMENISAVAEESAATTQEISASTEQQMASAEELSSHAKELNDLSAALNGELDKFKTE